MKKKRTLIAKLPKAKDGGQKDKWGRSANDVWYGFNPDKKEFSTKDQWGRAPGSEWYGFDPKLKTWTKGNKAYAAVKKENENVRDYYNQYMNSARYKSMLGFNPYIDQKRKENLGYTPKTLSINTTYDLYPKFPEAYKLNFSTIAPTVSVLPSQPKDKPDTGGWSRSKTGDIKVLPQGLGVRGLLPHEWSHSIDRPKVTNSQRLIPQKDIDYIKKATVNDDNILKLPRLKEYSNYTLDELKENYPEWIQNQIDWKNYVGEPTEVRARLNDIRYQSKKKGVYDPFTQEVTPEIYKKLENTKFEEGAKEGFDALKQLKGIYTDEQIMYMLNNISENAPSENDNVNYIDELPVAKYGGVIRKKTNEYKKGSMTKKRTVLTRLPKAQQGMPVPAPGSNPEEQGMAPQQQGMPPQEAQMQQQAPSPQAMDQQMQALLQEVASMLEQGADPMTIIGGLLQSGLVPEMVMQVIMQTGMAQDEQTASQMIQETMAQMQQGGGQQQPQAEGQPAPEQMQGQPMMALGGETALNDNIIEFAQLTGQSEKDIEDMVTAMIQEGTDAQTISDKLEEAITQIQQQQTQPQGMGQGMPQAAPGESQIQPPIIDGQTPAMRYGGPTPVDFQEIGQQIIKQYRKGGSSMGELDTSNTEAYVQNLKGAISNWVSTNNKIGLIKKRTENNLQLFDELPESVAMLPRAVKGIEIKGATYKHIRDLNKALDDKVITEEEYNKAIQDQKKDSDLFEVVQPEKKTETNTESKTETNTNSNIPNQGESYDSWALRTGKQSQPGTYTNMMWNGTQWVNTGANTNNPQYYYPGQYSDYGRSMSGQRYRPTNRFMSSVTDMAQGLARGNNEPFVQGIGALAGFSAEEVMKKVRERLADPNKPFTIEDIQRRGILGREKKGKRNKIGERIIWNPTTGEAETVTTDNASDPKDATAEDKPNLATDPNNIAALDKQMRGLLNSSDPKERETAEEYFEDKGRNPEMQKDPQFDGKEYNEYLDNNKKLEEQAIKNLGPNATKEAIYDEMDRLEEQGLDSEYKRPANVVTPLDSRNVGNVNSAYSILDPVTNETTLSGSPTMTNPDYFKPGNSAWQGRDYSDEEFWNQGQNTPGFLEQQKKDFGAQYENQIWSWDPAYENNKEAYTIPNRPELEFRMEDQFGMRYYDNTKTGRTEKFNPSGSTGYDPERGFYAQGGELNEKIIWDFKNKKFNKAPILVAKNGLYTPKIFSNPLNMFAEDSNLANTAENYSQSQGYEEGAEMVQQKSGLDWDKIANSIYGAGSFINEKKRLLNSATSKYEAADARAGMFNPITPRSGNEGLYTQFGDFIPDRTGAKVLPGTGSDQSANTEGAANNIFEDINPGGVNLFSRNGGVLKFAQDGIEIDQEYDLTEDDLNELMPYLQQLGLTIQMI